MRKNKFGKHIGKRARRRKHGTCPTCYEKTAELTLADVPAGGRARVAGFCRGIPADRLAHLQAYGLAPGYWVRVLQHRPVTIIQVEHTELALETELACEVLVMDENG
jgi:Fe2+ transport system protein FeoA